MLYLLPNLLSEEAAPELFLPAGLSSLLEKINGLIAESPKGGRAFLKRHLQTRKVADVPMALLNEHTKESEIDDLLRPLRQGEIWGVVTDAGLPCLADPGARLVAKARKANITVRALAGPSSITLALMLSGLSAQRFAFHGYLPRESAELLHALKTFTQRIRREKETQAFIEAPYRNMRLLETLLNHLEPDLILAIAVDLTALSEEIFIHTIAEWRALSLPSLDDRPAVFLVAR